VKTELDVENVEIREAYRRHSERLAAAPEEFRQRLEVVWQTVASLPGPLGDGPHVVVRGTGAPNPVPLRAPFVVGSDPGCDLTLDVDLVSVRHCRFSETDGDWWVEDLGSTNGTFVNGDEASETPLKDGDVIQVGEAQLVFFRPWRPEPLEEDG